MDTQELGLLINILKNKDRAYLNELIALYEEQLRRAPDNAQFRMENIIMRDLSP